MNVVFWSPVAGKSATSSNMIAVSIMSSIMYRLKSVLVQFDYKSRPIEDIFDEHKHVNMIMEEFAYYNQKGIDDILDKFQLDLLDEQNIRENMIPVRNINASYIPSSRRIGNGLNEREINEACDTLFDELGKVGDLNFIDSINENRSLSKKTLKKADVVVVNIHQGMNFEKTSMDKSILKKSVFLVGRYDEESNETLSVMRKKYDIPKDSIGVIPYNIAFHDALNEGKAVSFFSRNINAKRMDDNFTFINSIYRATEMIIRKAGINEQSAYNR